VSFPTLSAHRNLALSRLAGLQRAHSTLYSTISSQAANDPSSANALDEYTK